VSCLGYRPLPLAAQHFQPAAEAQQIKTEWYFCQEQWTSRDINVMLLLLTLGTYTVQSATLQVMTHVQMAGAFPMRLASWKAEMA